MEKENNNKRTANYTKEECWRLVQIIEKSANIIENKKTDALTWKDKKTAWQKVCLQFNSVGTQNRTWEQLRSKYETLKKETRRAAAKSRTEMLGTGGGPYYEPKLNPLYDKIREIIKLSADGTPSLFDSDHIDAETRTVNLSTCLNKDTQVVTNNDCMFTVSVIIVHNNDNSYFESHTENPSNSDLQLQQPQNSFTSASTTAVLDRAEATPKAFSVVQATNEADIPEVNDWSNYCPAQLKKQKHPALQTPKRKCLSGNRNISAAGQKMQPWVDAKAELTRLKLKLIQEEFNMKQQRERELHEQQLQLNNQQIKINQLVTEKLKLEIENMRK